MVGTAAASAVFDFENILPQLDFLPIAARRALDHAGLRLSLEAWRSLGLDDRCQLVSAGGNDIVDSSAVAAVVRRASPPAQRIEVVGDPDPLAPPDGLTRLLEPVPLDARQWARLRALDRYALAHVHRRSIARNDPSLIQAAYEDIVMGHLRSLRPPPGEAGGRSMGSTTPPPQVPPPPPLPRTSDVGRGRSNDTPPTRAYDGSALLARQAERSHEATPTPGRVQESWNRDPPSSQDGNAQPAFQRPATSRTQQSRDVQRDLQAALQRGYDATPSPARAEVRSYDSPPSPARGYEATPLAGRVEPRAYEHEPLPELEYEPPPLARAYEPPSRGRASSLPPEPPSRPSRPSRHPTPQSTRAVSDLIALGEEQLSNHLDAHGDAHMVDVGEKPVTARRAVASATVRMRRDTFRRLAQRDTPKGDVLAAARIAGIQAAKRTSELIPLCHLIALTHVEVHLELDGEAFCVHITATAEAKDRTGVEMEALVAASVASLTLYDMLKGIDRDMAIDDVKLLQKSGGRTGDYQRREA